MATFLGQQQQLHLFVTPCNLTNNLKPKPSRNVVIYASASNPPGEGASSSVPRGKWASALALNRERVSQPATPARDQVIEFGKYRGRYLGTLPEKYLTWITDNLHRGEYAEYCDLAEEVLEDPVYQDRKEWNRAQKYLHDEKKKDLYQSSFDMEQQVHLRFGWAPPHHKAWKQVEKELIGTSFTKIPRLRDMKDEEVVARRSVAERLREIKEEKRAQRSVIDAEEDARREERRERLQKSREKYVLTLKEKLALDDTELGKFKSRFGIHEEFFKPDDEEVPKPKSPFPGRQTMLNLKYAQFQRNKNKQ